MALIPEDGTGLPNADTYVDLAAALAYFQNHGSPAKWTALTDAMRESALRYAVRWLDSSYSWPGGRLTTTQSLEWPRAWAFARGGSYTGVVVGQNPGVLYGEELVGVPQLVKDAQCEFALAHVTSGALNAVLARGGLIESAALGPMSVKFAADAPAEAAYNYVDGLLSRIAARLDADPVGRTYS